LVIVREARECTMIAMRRAISLVLIFAFGGVAASHAVAWGLLLTPRGWFTDVKGPRGATSLDEANATWEVLSLISVPRSLFVSEIVSPAWDVSARSPANGAASAFPAYLGAREPRRDLMAAAASDRVWTCSETFACAGWPLRCTVMRMDGIAARHLVRREHFGSFTLEAHWWNNPWLGGQLPWRPLWPGLLANTAFYGVILWALWFTPGAVRRGLRRRRGACVRCGYDRRGGSLISCPECGTP
jgi:hypothetical protein